VPSALTLNAQTGTTYTFVLTDSNNTLVTASNASAQTYSIPTNAKLVQRLTSQSQLQLAQVHREQLPSRPSLALTHLYKSDT